MISISTYDRYNAQSGRYVRVETPEAPLRRPHPAQRDRETPQTAPLPADGPSKPPPREQRREGPARTAPQGQPGAFGSLLPAGLDTGDLMLGALLLFLYLESHDEDFLVMLLVIGSSLMKREEGSCA